MRWHSWCHRGRAQCLLDLLVSVSDNLRGLGDEIKCLGVDRLPIICSNLSNLLKGDEPMVLSVTAPDQLALAGDEPRIRVFNVRP